VVVNPDDYFLYLPLLPEAAGGVLEPRHVAVPLAAALPGVRLVIGEAQEVDADHRTVTYAEADGTRGTLRYDRLVLAAGAASTGLPVTHGRLEVDEFLAVPGHPEILACGDAAAVPDPAPPGSPPR
jgi:NADH dehydrogenase